VLSTVLPGPGTIYLGQTLAFKRSVAVGDVVTASVTAEERIAEEGRVIFDCSCQNERGETVITGTAELIAPKEKVPRAGCGSE